MRTLKSRAPMVVLVFSACVIGLTAILVRVAETGPAAAGFWRLGFALPWLLVLLTRARRDRVRAACPGSVAATRYWLGAPLWVMLVCGAMFAADLVCWHYSLMLTSIANSTVLANMTPVVVTVLTWVLLRQRPGGVFLAGLALAVGGAGLMAGAAHSGGAGSNPPLGDALALVTSCWYGLYFLCVSKARQTASAIEVMTGSTLVGAPLLLASAALLHENLLPTEPSGWLACALLGVVHVAGQGGVAWALGKVPTALAALVVLVQPVAASLLGWALFGEALSPVQAAGGALALCGVVLAQASARPRTPPGQGEALALAPEA